MCVKTRGIKKNIFHDRKDDFPVTIPRHLKPKICCYFENLAVNYYKFNARRSTDKFYKEQEIFGLNATAARALSNNQTWN